MTERVPTGEELVAMGKEYAVVSEWTMGSKNGKTPPKPIKIHITPKGHALIGDIMKRNATGTLARGNATEEAVARLKARERG